MKLRLISFLRRLSLLSSKKKFVNYPNEFAKLLTQKLSKLEKLIGFKIKDPTFYVKSLTHRSYSEFNDFNLRSNERLEFLGDAVLNMVIAEYLFKAFPNEDEGFLTKIRAQLVNRAALTACAEKINLFELMLVSTNFVNNPKGIQSIISNAMEALIGAIYLDAGLPKSREFIIKAVLEPSLQDKIFLVDRNFKSQLLEFAQANKLNNPQYKIINEEGPHHNKEFTIEVFIDDVSYGCGKGKNKKSAEQNAAQDALMKIGVVKKKAVNPEEINITGFEN